MYGDVTDYLIICLLQQTPMDNLPSQTAVLSDVPKKPEAKSVLISRLKSSSLLTQSPTSNITDQQNKNVSCKYNN